MLLEEALAAPGRGGDASSRASSRASSSSVGATGRPPVVLSPPDEARAVLSFLRDELPPGGVAAERRFANLVPLIEERAFGFWGFPPPGGAGGGGSPVGAGGSPRSPTTSPGGSTYSSPAAASSSSSSDPRSPPSPGGGRGRRYVHEQGGWLGLSSPPAPRSSDAGATNNNAAVQPPRPPPPDRDPIARLLRAPAPALPDDGAGDATFDRAPTLLDALSSEASRRVRARFPLAGLTDAGLNPTVEAWGALAREEAERERAPAGGGQRGGGFGAGGFGGAGGGFGAAPRSAAPAGVPGKDNAARILRALLTREGLSGQPELRNHFRREAHRRRRGFGTPPPYGAFADDRAGSVEPHVELCPLHRYLLLFARFPLASEAWEAQERDRANRRHGGAAGGRTAPYGQRVYFHLLGTYLRRYLPHGRNYDPAELAVGPDCFDALASFAIPDAEGVDRTPELFLRLLLEFWLEGSNSAPTTEDAAERYRRVRSEASSSAASAPTLSDAPELSRPSRGAYAPPNPKARAGTAQLIRHLASDPSLGALAKEVSATLRATRGGAGDRAPTPPLVGEAFEARTAPTMTPCWPLPPAATAAQPAVFNYVRLGLARGDLHDRSSTFHAATDAWLLWLEPWNWVTRRRAVAAPPRGGGGGRGGGGNGRRVAGDLLRTAAATVSSHRYETYRRHVAPKPGAPSGYSPEWEAYVVANAHLYVVPLAIFLRRALELDFAAEGGEAARSLGLVRRVTRVFSAPVAKVLKGALEGGGTGDADASATTSLLARHGANLGPFRPPEGWKLSDLRRDATNLLEEAFNQHRKRKAAMDVFDRFEARMSALFDGRAGGDEASLEVLLAQIGRLVDLPPDYRPLPDEPPPDRSFALLRRLAGFGSKGVEADGASATATRSRRPDRGPDGRLTDLGRAQLVAGTRRCDPLELRWVGDPMLAPPASREVPVLVDLTVWTSERLNEALGLEGLGLIPPLEGPVEEEDEDDVLSQRYREMARYEKTLVRVNLRFLADPRNWAFIAVLWYMFKTIRWVFWR